MKRISLICLIIAVISLGMTSTATAQEEEFLGLGVSMGVFTSYSSSSTTAIGIPVGVVLTIVWVVTRDDQASLQQYMEDNAVAMQHDLYIGGGETTDDLASLFGIHDHQRNKFSEILVQNRQRLASLATPGEIDEEAAYQFANIIIDELEARGWRQAA